MRRTGSSLLVKIIYRRKDLKEKWSPEVFCAIFEVMETMLLRMKTVKSAFATILRVSFLDWKLLKVIFGVTFMPAVTYIMG